MDAWVIWLIVAVVFAVGVTARRLVGELHGREGNDVIIGGGGFDYMDGGPGDDVYVYRTAGESLAASYDVIILEGGRDRIDLRAVHPTSISWQETIGGYWQNFAISNMVTVETAVGAMTSGIRAASTSRRKTRSSASSCPVGSLIPIQRFMIF